MPKVLDFGKLVTKDIKGVEIFATGTWNGQKFTTADLDAMTEAFNETKDQIIPPLKLGHTPDQKLAQEDGLPALGWVQNLYRQGNKLIADFSKMPQKIFDLVQAGGYRKVSIELWRNMKAADKVYPMMIKAVSLLGADTPAVQTLDDIIALYSIKMEDPAHQFSAEAAETFELEKNEIHEEDTAMPLTLEQLQAAYDKQTTQLSQAISEIEGLKKAAGQDSESLQTKVTELTQSIASITKERDELKAKVDDFSAKFAKISDENFRAQAKAKTQELLEGKKIVPAQSAMVEEALFSALKAPSAQTFTLGEKVVNAYEWQVELFSKGSASVNTGGESDAGASSSGDEQLIEMTAKIMKETASSGRPIPYKEAMIEAEKTLKANKK